jgi:hypothetical protein
LSVFSLHLNRIGNNRKKILEVLMFHINYYWTKSTKHAHGRWFSPSTPAFSTGKTGRRDIAEILLRVALKHQKLNQSIYKTKRKRKHR